MKNQICIQVRFTAYLFLMIGVLLLLHNLVLSYDSFNPSYFGHYLKQELLTPCLLILAGIGSRILSKVIAAWILKSLDHTE